MDKESILICTGSGSGSADLVLKISDLDPDPADQKRPDPDPQHWLILILKYFPTIVGLKWTELLGIAW